MDAIFKGASFQITCLDDVESPNASAPDDVPQRFRTFMGAFGTSVTIAMLVREVVGSELILGCSINPGM